MVNQNKIITISTIDIFKGINTEPDSRKHIKCKGHIDGDNDWCDYDTTITCDECKYGGSYDANDKRRGKDPEAMCNQLKEKLS